MDGGNVNEPNGAVIPVVNDLSSEIPGFYRDPEVQNRIQKRKEKAKEKLEKRKATMKVDPILVELLEETKKTGVCIESSFIFCRNDCINDKNIRYNG